MIDFVLDILKTKEVDYKENLSMAALTTIRLGGKARAVLFPKSKEELTFFVDFLVKTGVKYKVVGKMSNVLPTDTDYNGVLIRTDKIRGITKKSNLFSVCCGESLPYLSCHAAKDGYSGLEELSGIPATLGGSVFGNAGAYGRSISDLLFSAEIYDIKENKIIFLSANELDFSYRNSILKRKDYILLSANLLLKDDDRLKIFGKIKEYKEKRALSQPNMPSLGSVFKRNGNISASKLIDLCGLKGTCIGGAEISKKHAGFIVNNGGASSEDVKALVRIAEKTVYEKFNIHLEREIEYLD